MNKDTLQTLDEQLLLFAPFLSDRHNRVFELYDALPRFVLSWKRDAEKGPRTLTFPNVQIGEQVVSVKITPAIVSDPSKTVTTTTGPQRGTGKIIFPGAREEIIEFALRRLAVRQHEGLSRRLEKDREHIAVKFRLSELRSQLAEDGHHFKNAEIAEALEVLANSQLQLSGDVPENIAEGYKWKATQAYSMLADLRAIEPKEGDPSGEKTTYVVSLHPLAAAAILQGRFFDHNHARTMQLRKPLARWLIKRMNLRYRQAQKNSFATSGSGYKIGLSRILAESGMLPEKRLRASIERIRDAIKELTNTGWLHCFKPYDEATTLGPSTKKGGRKTIQEIVWTLYPSNEFAQEVIEGNMRRQALKNGESRAKL